MSAQQARERKKNYVQTLEERNQLQVGVHSSLVLYVQLFVGDNHSWGRLCQQALLYFSLRATQHKQGHKMHFAYNSGGRARGNGWDTCRQGISKQAGTCVWQLLSEHL